jgi:four helix bundle protein
LAQITGLFCRARSKAEFFAKLSVTIEEADEVIFWTEILKESDVLNNGNITDFEKEAKEIVAVLTTARSNTK